MGTPAFLVNSGQHGTEAFPVTQIRCWAVEQCLQLLIQFTAFKRKEIGALQAFSVTIPVQIDYLK